MDTPHLWWLVSFLFIPVLILVHSIAIIRSFPHSNKEKRTKENALLPQSLEVQKPKKSDKKHQKNK
jgi:hypothetical protein